jgi:hypothetical protein
MMRAHSALKGRIVACIHILSHSLHEIWIAFAQLHRALFGLLIIAGRSICGCEGSEGRVVPRGRGHRSGVGPGRIEHLSETPAPATACAR